MPRDTILMCHPSEFDVSYVINPWMEGHVDNSVVKNLAMDQWTKLSQIIASLANLNVMWQEPGLPDMVFTANAGIIVGNKFIPSNFKHEERRGEETRFIDWFLAEGFDVINVPVGIAFEGAGDALYDHRGILWMGHGHRTDLEAGSWLWKNLQVTVTTLKLVDDRFYHLDTCFCPLKGGYLMYYPPAFDDISLGIIHLMFNEDKRIVVDEEDALKFACNAVNIGDNIVLNEVSQGLKDRLEGLDFKVITTPLSEFMKAGGSAKCLTIKLN